MSSDISFPSADLDEDLNSSGNNVHLEVDPVSSEVAATQKSKVLPIKRTSTSIQEHFFFLYMYSPKSKSKLFSLLQKS